MENKITKHDKIYTKIEEDVIKALDKIKPLNKLIEKSKKISFRLDDIKFNDRFTELLSKLTKTSRRYVLDKKFKLNDYDDEKENIVIVNEKGLGYVRTHDKHSTNLCSVYQMHKIKKLFLDNDMVLYISQSIKREHQIDFLKLVELFNEYQKEILSYNNTIETLSFIINDDITLNIKSNDVGEGINDIKVEGKNDMHIMESTPLLTELIHAKVNEIKDYSLYSLNIKDIFMLNLLVEKIKEVEKAFEEQKIIEQKFCDIAKTYIKEVDDKLKIFEAYENI